jgi:glycosyltransferase involved in cell wall biosynthesis
MEPRLVSVILPVHNGGRYLQDAVDSILAQTHGDLELLVVDDHSTDGRVAALRTGDPRVSVTRSRGRGVAKAFNTGLKRARGAFIARMDADDIALPERLEAQLSLFDEHAEVDIAGGCVRFIGGAGVAGGNLRYAKWLNSVRTPREIRSQIYIESPIPNPTAMFRAPALRQLGGYRNCGWPEDYDLFLRADRAGMQMAKPDAVLLEWRDHPDRLTRTDPLYTLERFQAAKAHYLADYRLPVREVVIWGAGPTGKQFHDLLEAVGITTRYFIDVHPRRVGGAKRDKPVYGLQQAGRRDGTFTLVAVGARGARAKIRNLLDERGCTEGEDYLFAA